MPRNVVVRPCRYTDFRWGAVEAPAKEWVKDMSETKPLQNEGDNTSPFNKIGQNLRMHAPGSSGDGGEKDLSMKVWDGPGWVSIRSFLGQYE